MDAARDRASCARHVADDDLRIAWNETTPVPRVEARRNVVAAARREADDDRDCLAGIEIRRRRNARAGKTRAEDYCGKPDDIKGREF